ncbi:MAG TPA: hypothetical protein PKX92_03960 [Edaphocola sp.]|nr:hypothetical protein [Edaphocola sp.]
MDLNTESNIKPVYWLSFFTLIILAVLSLIAYKERTLFVDSSWFIVNMLHTKSFYFMEMRYGAFITQLGTITAIRFGMDLKSILIIFSVSFYVFYLLSFWAIGVWMRQKKLAILFLLYLVLFISDGYFCTVGEIFQGITWMFLFFALYLQTRWRHNLWTHGLMIAFAFLSLICHMIIWFPFAFMWLYLNLEQNKIHELIRQKKFWIYSLILLLFALTRYYVSNLGWYDSMKLEPVKNLSFSRILGAFKSGHAQTFLNLLKTNYWLVVSLGFVSILFMAIQKKYFQLVLYFVFVAGYFSLVCVVYPDGYDRNMLFYFENEWAPLAVIIAAPFVWHIFNYLHQVRVLAAVFLVIFAIRLFFIFDAYLFFNNRFHNLKNLNESLYKSKIHKAIIYVDEAEAKKYFVMDWGLPIESLLLSALDAKKPNITFKTTPPDFIVRQPKDSFYSCFQIMPNSFLNQKYIQIDSLQAYQPIPNIKTFNLKANQ